jgi:hypothetical protein
MIDNQQDHLRILGQLALEYEKKYTELEEIIRTAKPEMVAHQLRLRSELTTDRFRAAQQALFESLSSKEGEVEMQQQAAVALCRCFDEMRILFQFLLDHCSESR